jgi:general secretion pathway protein G
MRSGERIPRRAGGFTLIELLVVLAIVALMLTIATPRTLIHLERSREAALKTNLREMRHAIEQFDADRGRLPESLEELVSQRYLREVPLDTVTERRDTWLALGAAEADALRGDATGVPLSQPDAAAPPRSGMADVRSGAPGEGLDGSAYGIW